VDQQAQQQQVKQHKAVNAVKKLTKSVYERLTPAPKSPVMDTALSRHSGAGQNSSQQSEGLDSGLRRGDEMNKDILPLPQGEGRGEGSSSIKNLPALPDETI